MIIEFQNKGKFVEYGERLESEGIIEERALVAWTRGTPYLEGSEHCYVISTP